MLKNSKEEEKQIKKIDKFIYRGGLWKQVPVSFLIQLSNSVRFSTGLWNLTIPTYSLPADCWALTNLVALLIQTIKQPVTLGSRVPEWPIKENYLFNEFKQQMYLI